MNVSTNVNAGATTNHNETIVRDAAKKSAPAKGLVVKTNIKAGGTRNHNETIVRDAA